MKFGVIGLEVCQESLVAVSLITLSARHVSNESSGLANEAMVCL